MQHLEMVTPLNQHSEREKKKCKLQNAMLVHGLAYNLSVSNERLYIEET